MAKAAETTSGPEYYTATCFTDCHGDTSTGSEQQARLTRWLCAAGFVYSASLPRNRGNVANAGHRLRHGGGSHRQRRVHTYRSGHQAQCPHCADGAASRILGGSTESDAAEMSTHSAEEQPLRQAGPASSGRVFTPTIVGVQHK
jgi:hypothetical protein